MKIVFLSLFLTITLPLQCAEFEKEHRRGGAMEPQKSTMVEAAGNFLGKTAQAVVPFLLPALAAAQSNNSSNTGVDFSPTLLEIAVLGSSCIMCCTVCAIATVCKVIVEPVIEHNEIKNDTYYGSDGQTEVPPLTQVRIFNDQAKGQEDRPGQ